MLEACLIKEKFLVETLETLLDIYIKLTVRSLILPVM